MLLVSQNASLQSRFVSSAAERLPWLLAQDLNHHRKEHPDECFLLLVDETSTQVDELTEAANLLKDHNLLGSVLNKSEAPVKNFEGYYQSENGS